METETSCKLLNLLSYPEIAHRGGKGVGGHLCIYCIRRKKSLTEIPENRLVALTRKPAPGIKPLGVHFHSSQKLH